MGKFLSSILIVLFLVGCTEENGITQTNTDYESQINDLQKEIQELKAEIEELNEHNSNLQIADYNSRKIMRLILEGKFDELENEFKTNFDVSNGEIFFAEPDGNLPFRVELAGNPMYIASYTNSPDGTDINYFIDDPIIEKSLLINFHYDKDMNFKYLFVGGE